MSIMTNIYVDSSATTDMARIINLLSKIPGMAPVAVGTNSGYQYEDSPFIFYVNESLSYPNICVRINVDGVEKDLSCTLSCDMANVIRYYKTSDAIIFAIDNETQNANSVVGVCINKENGRYVVHHFGHYSSSGYRGYLYDDRGNSLTYSRANVTDSVNPNKGILTPLFWNVADDGYNLYSNKLKSVNVQTVKNRGLARPININGTIYITLYDGVIYPTSIGETTTPDEEIEG